jgi:hypothetical protein
LALFVNSCCFGKFVCFFISIWASMEC